MILTPHCVFIVDVKGTHGSVRIIEPNWYPENRQPFPSPVKKIRNHARVLKGLIVETNSLKRKLLQQVHVQEAVLMMAEDIHIIDETGRDEDSIIYIGDHCINYFKSPGCIPTERNRTKDIRPFLKEIHQAILGKAKPPSTPLRYRDWQVEEKLGGNEQYTEYLAKRIGQLDNGLKARLRVYQVDPYQDQSSRQEQLKMIMRAYEAVYNLRHPGILTIREYFETDDGDRAVLVIEDLPSQSLRQYINQSE